jgi:hypothetical protein
MSGRVLIVTMALSVVSAADVCNPRDFHGVYGFQLNGTTTIGSQPQPVVSIGRLDFDGTGGVSAVISLSFTGIYQGDPATGKYDTGEDCAISWDLQDVSGNHQHFEGTLSEDARSARFRQTDPGAPTQGTLVKAADACQDRDFQARYRFLISGKRVDVNTAQVDSSVSVRGSMQRQGSQLTLNVEGGSGTPGTGTVEVDGDCFVHLDLTFPQSTGDPVEMKFRGMLVQAGAELIGMETDPGTAVSVRLTAP